MLEDTLVIWGGEFGRTVYSQGEDEKQLWPRPPPRCYSVWMAGAGVKGGHVHGETDEFSYNIVKDPVHIHDLNATALHLLGIEHERLTYRFQGRDYRLNRLPRRGGEGRAGVRSVARPVVAFRGRSSVDRRCGLSVIPGP